MGSEISPLLFNLNERMISMAGRPKKTTTENTVKDEKVAETKTVKETKVKEQRSLNEMVCVKNNTHGKLVYVSKRFAGQEYEWEKFGDENWLELQELISMRNSYPTYFRECWVMLSDEDLEYLNVKKYYENIIDMEDFDDIFKLSPAKLKEKLEHLPKSMKDSVSKRSRQLIASGELDSIKTINTIKDVLKVDFTI
jgi:hypothetical protein